MKRRQKSQLIKLMKNESEDYTYETTERATRLWFNIINKEIFDSKLSPPTNIDIRWRRGTYAYYTFVNDDKDPDYFYSTIHLNKKYRSKRFFVEVLGHEMIHHYQAMYRQPYGHGPSFKDWTEKFNEKGLRLQLEME